MEAVLPASRRESLQDTKYLSFRNGKFSFTPTQELNMKENHKMYY